VADIDIVGIFVDADVSLPIACVLTVFCDTMKLILTDICVTLPYSFDFVTAPFPHLANYF